MVTLVEKVFKTFCQLVSDLNAHRGPATVIFFLALAACEKGFNSNSSSGSSSNPGASSNPTNFSYNPLMPENSLNNANNSGVNNECLDITGDSTSPGVVLQQWQCTKGPNQSFALRPAAGGFVTIEVQSSGLCLDSGTGANIGGISSIYPLVAQNTCSGTSGQQWKVVVNSDGSYTFQTQSGLGCMNVNGDSSANGAQVIIYACGDWDNEKFMLGTSSESPPPPSPTPIPSPNPSPTPSSTGACGDEPPPPQALAAGFTTCAANFDWTASTGAQWLPSQYAFNGPVSDTSNWLDCTGIGDLSLPWHWGTITGAYVGYPCSQAVTVTTDPIYGTQVLDLHWDTAWGPIGLPNGTGYWNNIGIQWGTNNWPSAGQPSFTMPLTKYIELTSRVSLTTSNSLDQPNEFYDQTTNTDCPLAYTDPELYSGDSGQLADMGSGGAAGELNYCQPGGFTVNTYATGNCMNGTGACYWPGFPSGGWTATVYHKYGLLITSDGATNIYACSFADDQLAGCDNGTGNSYIGEFTARDVWTLQNMPGGNSENWGDSHSYYIQSVKIWTGVTCVTDGDCNGSTLFDSGGLRYWHN